jgi:hypothetical protein
MIRKVLATVLAFLFIFSSTSSAIGASKWWATSWSSSWFESGRTCWAEDEGTKIGQKFKYSYKIGTSTKWVSLGTAIAVDGVEATTAGVDPEDNELGLEDNCELDYPIATQAPRVPSQPGAYVIKIEALDSKGKVMWTDTSNMLLMGTGATASSYFGTVPRVTLPSYVYQNVQTGSFMTIYGAKRLAAYDLKGNPRHACMLFYDLAVNLFPRSQKNVTTYDLQYSITQGSMGQIIANYFGLNGGTIKAGAACAPWVAKNLP